MVGSLVMALLYAYTILFLIITVKNFENRLIFDEVKAYRNGVILATFY